MTRVEHLGAKVQRNLLRQNTAGSNRVNAMALHQLAKLRVDVHHGSPFGVIEILTILRSTPQFERGFDACKTAPSGHGSVSGKSSFRAVTKGSGYFSTGP